MVKQVEKVETAVEPRFQEHFIEAMAIPHKTAPYDNLRQVVTLPAPKEAASPAGDDRSTRRRRSRS